MSGHAYAYSTSNELDGVILLYNSYDSSGNAYNNTKIEKLETSQTYTLDVYSEVAAFFLDYAQTDDNSGQYTIDLYNSGSTTPDYTLTVKGKENAINVDGTGVKVQQTVAKGTYTLKASGHAYAYSTSNELDGVMLLYNSYDSNGIAYNNTKIEKLETGQTYTLDVYSEVVAFFLDYAQTDDNSGQFTIDLYK